MTATATAKTADPRMVLAKQIIADNHGGKLRNALAKAQRGAQKYPDFRFPAQNESDPSPTFAEVAEWLTEQLAAQEAVEVPVAEAAPEPVAPVKAEPAPKTRSGKARVKAEPAPEPVAPKVQTSTLRLVHDGENPTVIHGVEKLSPAHLIVGTREGGEGWKWWRAKPDAFYLPRTGGFAPDTERIRSLIKRLEAEKVDGVPLYRVETDIVTELNGVPLPVKRTAAELREWQRAFDAAHNALYWGLGVGRETCGGCGAQGLTRETGRIDRDGDGMPMVKCNTCAGVPVVEAAESAPAKMDLSSLLALPATAAPVPDMAECPSCRTQQRVIDGRLDLHERPFGGALCRGRLGVAVEDVEPESAPEKPGRKARKAEQPVDQAATATVATDVWRFKLQAGLSGKSRNDVATNVRRAILRAVTNKFGVKVEVRRDKVNHQLVMTVVEWGSADVDGELLTATLVAAVRSVPGVGNQMHKSA